MSRMRNRGWSLLVGWLCAAGVFAAAAEWRVVGETDKEPATYAPGETMVFRLRVLSDGQPAPGQKLAWVRKGDDGQVTKGEATTGAEGADVSTAIDKPGFVLLTATLLGEDGKPRKNGDGKDIVFTGGAGAVPDQLAGVAEPADFDAFWQARKAELAKVPLRFDLTPVESGNPAVEVFDVKVDCAGAKPVSGYLARPKGAQPKSLPAIVSYHGYGIRSAGKPEGHAAQGLLAFDVNAHGIENGQPKEFYSALGAAELKGYGLKGNEKPEDSYFRGMMLRVLRSLEFVKVQPEWDGKTLIVSGGSQGGLQAITAAGLDGDVSFCLASKPWMCDLSGYELGRLKGWRPEPAPGLAYYDAANHAKRARCEASLDAGLGDTTCPPSGVAIVFNNLAGPKALVYIQGASHLANPPKAPNAWGALGRHLNKVRPAAQ